MKRTFRLRDPLRGMPIGRRMVWKITGLMVFVAVLATVVLQAAATYLVISQTTASKDWTNEIKAQIEEQRRVVADCFPEKGPPDLVRLTQILDNVTLAQADVPDGIQINFLTVTLGHWYAAVARPDGRVIAASPTPERFPIQSQILDRLAGVHRDLYRSAQVGNTEVVWRDGQTLVAAPLIQQNRVVAVFIAHSEVLFDGWRTWQRIMVQALVMAVIIGGVTGMIGLVVGAVVARQLSRRLTAIAQTTERWSKGDMEPRAAERPADELGLLGAHLNRMANGLQQVMVLRNEIATLEERQRISRDLHDTVKQEAFATAMMVASAQRFHAAGDSAGVERGLHEAFELSRQMQTNLATILDQLRGPVPQGTLAENLIETTNAWRRRCDLDIETDVPVGVTYPVNEQALRIVDEALANAVKHSQGQSVAVRLSREARGPKIVIEDDGRGFATKASSEGYGMTSMRERSLRLPNGELRVESTPGQGTRVTLRYEEEEQK